MTDGSRRGPFDWDNVKPTSLEGSGFAWNSPRLIVERLVDREERDEDEIDRAQWNALVRPQVLAWARDMHEKGCQWPISVEGEG